MSYNITPTQTVTQGMHSLCYDAYLGVGGFLNKSYLIPFGNEQKNYEDRQLYSEYQNKIAPIMDSLVTPVFANDIQRNDTNDIQDAFINNCDGAGLSLDKFMQRVGTFHKLQGNVFIIMDNYKDIPKRTQDVIAERKYPYLYSKLAQEIYKYKVDKFGVLEYIEFYYQTLTDKDGKETIIYRHIDANWEYDFSISNKKQTLVAEKVPSVGDGIPVIMTGTSVLPIPPMYSLCAMAKTLFNQQSETRKTSRSTMFSLLQLPMEKPNADGDVQLGNLLYIGDDATKDAKWVSPDASTMTSGLDASDRTSMAIDNVAKSYGAVPILSEGQTSGVAYAYEFSGNTYALTDLANDMTETENKIFNLFAEFFPFTNIVVVEYDKNYTPGKTQLMDSYTILKEVIDRNVSPTATREWNKSLVTVANMLAQIEMDDATIDKINNEIDTLTSLTALETIGRMGLGDAIIVELEVASAKHMGLDNYVRQDSVNDVLSDEDLDIEEEE